MATILLLLEMDLIISLSELGLLAMAYLKLTSLFNVIPAQQLCYINPWIELWSNETGSDTSMEEYLSTLPSFSRGRNDPARCKFDHVTNATDDNLLIKHNLRRIIWALQSKRGGVHMYLSAFIIKVVLAVLLWMVNIPCKTQMHPRLSLST
ncbi:LOW QUALITY PROTEIN: Chymase [Phytophthora palmivora]|uniref:Chymase n=1 Tax=Phytophthora palmivora TaxID=4796 RepID=A0A2P4XMP4_9STRA|nr:LOW QUALITY PROTEIN: Chymase [Phytophthora palmivora]